MQSSTNQPSPPTWLDKEFIQTTLRSADRDPTITVVDIEIKMATSVGDNYSSDMFRVLAKLQRSSDDAEEMRSLIVKCQPMGGKREEVIREFKMFNIEIGILTTILPEMFKLLNKAAPAKFEIFFAKCLHHSLGPFQFLVLEDLSPLGYLTASRWVGLDLEHSLSVIKSIAHFHAASVALYEQNPSLLTPYINMIDEDKFSDELKETCQHFVRSAFLSVIPVVEMWPEYRERYTQKLMTLSETYSSTEKEQRRYKEEGFNVLLHGDLWVNNIMFRYNLRKITGLRLVDYQMCRFSSPARDLQYFIHTSVSEDVYTGHLDTLIAEYHSTLSSTMALLDCEKSITLEQLKRELDVHALYGLFAAITVLPGVLAKSDDVFDLEASLDPTRESSNRSVYLSPAYVKAMKRLLPIFEAKGVF